MSWIPNEDLENMVQGLWDKIDIKKLVALSLQNSERKQKLSEKVLSGKKLSNSEKQEICKLLTGKEPLVTKRGRPTAKERDARLAYDYLAKKDEGKNGLGNIREKLTFKYDMPQRDNTFYKAIANGIKALESKSKDFFASLNNRHDYYDMEKLQDFDLDMINEETFVTEIIKDKNIAEQILYWRYCLKLIQNYRAENDHLKK